MPSIRLITKSHSTMYLLIQGANEGFGDVVLCVLGILRGSVVRAEFAASKNAFGKRKQTRPSLKPFIEKLSSAEISSAPAPAVLVWCLLQTFVPLYQMHFLPQKLCSEAGSASGSVVILSSLQEIRSRKDMEHPQKEL